MDITINRNDFSSSGIFGVMLNDQGVPIAVTLEHAYLNNDGTFSPKVPAGTYTCARGLHLLEGMKAPFETFEVTNVPGHTDILIHWGNWNNDSSGCFLVGQTRVGIMITKSLLTFGQFMQLQQGVDFFTLSVTDGT